MRALFSYLRERRAAAAVEMALILPAVLFLMLGGANLVFLTYATISLHNATEAAARYASTWTADNSGTQPPTTSGNVVVTAASGWYRGPSIGQTFTYATTGSCGTTGANGNLVTGSGTYHLYFGIGRIAVPISTTACFP